MTEVGPWSLVEGLGLPAAIIAMLIWVVGKYLNEQGKDIREIKTNIVQMVTTINNICQRIDRLVDRGRE